MRLSILKFRHIFSAYKLGATVCSAAKLLGGVCWRSENGRESLGAGQPAHILEKLILRRRRLLPDRLA